MNLAKNMLGMLLYIVVLYVMCDSLKYSRSFAWYAPVVTPESLQNKMLNVDPNRLSTMMTESTTPLHQIESYLSGTAPLIPWDCGLTADRQVLFLTKSLFPCQIVLTQKPYDSSIQNSLLHDRKIITKWNDFIFWATRPIDYLPQYMNYSTILMIISIINILLISAILYKVLKSKAICRVKALALIAIWSFPVLFILYYQRPKNDLKTFSTYINLAELVAEKDETSLASVGGMPVVHGTYPCYYRRVSLDDTSSLFWGENIAIERLQEINSQMSFERLCNNIWLGTYSLFRNELQIIWVEYYISVGFLVLFFAFGFWYIATRRFTRHNDLRSVELKEDIK